MNSFVMDLTVSTIDYLYRGRDYQRFWVLEEIARAPYFAFLSVLHLRESLGLRGPDHINLMREHFEQTLNETGKVRGLLCDSCNTAIGLLGEDISRLERAVIFLNNNNNNNTNN